MFVPDTFDEESGRFRVNLIKERIVTTEGRISNVAESAIIAAVALYSSGIFDLYDPVMFTIKDSEENAVRTQTAAMLVTSVANVQPDKLVDTFEQIVQLFPEGSSSIKEFLAILRQKIEAGKDKKWLEQLLTAYSTRPDSRAKMIIKLLNEGGSENIPCGSTYPDSPIPPAEKGKQPKKKSKIPNKSKIRRKRRGRY